MNCRRALHGLIEACSRVVGVRKRASAARISKGSDSRSRANGAWAKPKSLAKGQSCRCTWAMHPALGWPGYGWPLGSAPAQLRRLYAQNVRGRSQMIGRVPKNPTAGLAPSKKISTRDTGIKVVKTDALDRHVRKLRDPVACAGGRLLVDVNAGDGARSGGQALQQQTVAAADIQAITTMTRGPAEHPRVVRGVVVPVVGHRNHRAVSDEAQHSRQKSALNRRPAIRSVGVAGFYDVVPHHAHLAARQTRSVSVVLAVQLPRGDVTMRGHVDLVALGEL
jgi:hypothetical protein